MQRLNLDPKPIIELYKSNSIIETAKCIGHNKSIVRRVLKENNIYVGDGKFKKGHISLLKNKTYEDVWGVEKAKKIKEKLTKPKKYLRVTYLDKSKFKKYGTIDTSFKITEDLAKLIGYILADGSINKDYSIGFTSQDYELLDGFRRCVISIFKSEKLERSSCKYKNKKAITIRFSPMLGRALINKFGYFAYGKSSHTKFIPNDFMNTEGNIKTALIRALIDCDGGVYFRNKKNESLGGTIKYTSTSEQLIQQTSNLLNYFNINHKIQTRIYDCYGKQGNMFVIILSGRDSFLKYSKFIGFDCIRKQNRLDYLCNLKMYRDYGKNQVFFGEGETTQTRLFNSGISNSLDMAT